MLKMTLEQKTLASNWKDWLLIIQTQSIHGFQVQNEWAQNMKVVTKYLDRFWKADEESWDPYNGGSKI